MRIASLVGMLAVMLLAGCREEVPIVEYKVSREIPESLRNKSAPKQMLAAIIREEETLWFFKLSGPPTAIDEVREVFKGWLKSVHYEDGKPLWTAPESWQTMPASGMRFATFVIPTTSEKLEATVTQLPFDGNWETSVRENVNRWRKQVSLPASDDKLAGAESLGLEKNPDAVLIDVLGEATEKPGSGMMPGMPPMMASGMGPSGAGEGSEAPPKAPNATASNANAPSEATSGIEFKAPKSWRPGKMSMMRLAAFEAGPDDRTAEITVIMAGGDPKSNVDRWMKQIRSAVTPDDLEKAMAEGEEVPVGDTKGTLYRLLGDGDKATYAIIAPNGEGSSLFIKMSGAAKTAEEEEESFKAFAESLKLPTPG